MLENAQRVHGAIEPATLDPTQQTLALYLVGAIVICLLIMVMEMWAKEFKK